MKLVFAEENSRSTVSFSASAFVARWDVFGLLCSRSEGNVQSRESCRQCFVGCPKAFYVLKDVLVVNRSERDYVL